MSITRDLYSSRREIVWLADALQECLGFPQQVRARIGCELVTIHRWGIGKAWESMRGAPGTAAYTVHSALDRIRVPYRIVVSTAIPNATVILHAMAPGSGRASTAISARDIGFVRARLKDVELDRRQPRDSGLPRVCQVEATGNPFLQLGFASADADEWMRRAELIAELRQDLRRRAEDGHASLECRAILAGDIEALSCETLLGVAGRVQASRWI